MLDTALASQTSDATNVANSQDVSYMYNLFLRRDPESAAVVQERLGKDLWSILEAMAGSPEFSLRLTELARTQTLAAPSRSSASFRTVLSWAANKLPVGSETRRRLSAAADWDEADLALMQDREIVKLAEAFEDPAVRGSVRLRALWSVLRRLPRTTSRSPVAPTGRGAGRAAEAGAHGPEADETPLLEDAHLLLDLGKMLRDQGKRVDAIEAFRRSLALEASLAAIEGLRALDVSVDVAHLPRPARDPQILFEISDLFSDLLDNVTISGIQRIQLGVISFVLSEHEAGRALDCELVWWIHDDLWKLDPDSLADVVQLYQSPEVRDGAYRAKIIEALKDKGELVVPVRGDVLVSTGVIYRQQNLLLNNAALKRAGVTIGAYIHDFIPLTHPEYCDGGLSEGFSKTMAVALLQYDFALTVSEHVEREMRRLLAHSGYTEIPIRAVPEPHAIFGQSGTEEDEWTPTIADLDGVEYVLCVGTFSSQKNQALLVQIWQILIHEGIEPPVLVLVGRRGHNVNDLMAQLSTTRNLDGRIKVLEGLGDGELKTLYRNCLFTMQPSHVEGWGLPIGESVAAGKVCIASNAASIPEVGGEFAIYIDPHDARGAANVTRELLLDRDQLRRLEARIRDDFRPRTWEEHVSSLIDAVRDLSDPEAEPKQTPITMPFGRAVRTFKIHEAWKSGTFLPPRQAVADDALRQLLLEQNWYPTESWGAWMKGASGRIGFTIESGTSASVRVALQFRAAPWATSNQFQITSRCGASVVTRLPEPRGYPEFLVWLDCRADEDGRVELSLDVLGGIPGAWWGETRQFCVGLERVLCLPQAAAERTTPANRLIKPATAFRVYGTSSMIAALERCAVLKEGWREPEPGVAQMLGAAARIELRTESAPDETVRVALQLRAQPGQAGEIVVESACGAQTRLTLSASDPRDCSLWLDASPGEDGTIALVIRVEGRPPNAHEPGLLFSPVLTGLAYGARDASGAAHFALVEALAFPDRAAEPDSFRLAYENDLRFTVSGHIAGSYSLAATNRRLALALDAARPGTVRIEQVEGGRSVRDLTRIPAGERAGVAELARREWHEEGPVVEIVQHWPVWVGPHHADFRLAWVAWEESLLPADMVQFLNQKFDGVLVQTRFVAKAMIDSGVHIPVRLMGYAPDLDAFAEAGAARAGERPLRTPSEAAPFVFLHVSSCFPRKGVDALLAAYAAAFRSSDPVRLVIKTFPNPHNDVPEQVRALQEADPDLPEIVIVNRDLPTGELAALFAQADAVVLPTRGEGFNLPAAEALASGTPLIVTGHSGQVDFAGPDVARPVDFCFAESRSHVRSEGSVWADPDVDDLAAAMRELFALSRDPGAQSAVAAEVERGRRVAAELGDAGRWAERIRAIAVDMICANRTGRPRPPTVAWVSTWNVPCGVATYSNYLLGRYPEAARDVVVLCDERTREEDLSQEGWPSAQVAWRLDDPTSSVRIASAVAALGAGAVVIQHQRGLIKSDVVAALLMDERLSGREIVVALHNPRELPDYPGWETLCAALETVSRIVVHGVSDLNLLKSWGLVDNVTLLPHGTLRPSAARPNPRDLPPGAAPVIGTYGFMFPDKGNAILIEAFAKLRRHWPGARLRMVTAQHAASESGAEIARCQALALTLGVADAVEWHTRYLPDAESLDLLSGCDLVALPRRETPESASGAVRMAMASGAPVLVTPVKIFDDVGDCVLRAESLSADSVAAAMAAALGNRTARAETVQRAERWLEACDWGVLSERLQGMIRGLVNNPNLRRR